MLARLLNIWEPGGKTRPTATKTTIPDFQRSNQSLPDIYLTRHAAEEVGDRDMGGVQHAQAFPILTWATICRATLSFLSRYT